MIACRYVHGIHCSVVLIPKTDLVGAKKGFN